MNRTLRMPALILLPLLLVAGLVIQSRDDGTSAPAVRLSELTATAAGPGTPSSTWYCAAGSATGVASGEGAGPAEQVVVIANASDTDSVGTVTLFPAGAAPKAVPVQVAAHSRFELRVSNEVKAPWAAALVETTGGEITVGHDLSGPSGHSVSDCASTPSAEWYFPAGLSRVGNDIYLALFNPFPGEATVDLSFDTDNGIRSVQSYQGIVVPGGSVAVEKVSEKVTETDHVATNVSVRSGRIIAEQIQTLDGRDGRPKGLTATVGATTPAAVWSFPMSAPADVDAAETVAVFNPGDTDTDVLVQVQLDDPSVSGTVEPFEVTVPAHRVITVDLRDPGDQRIPPGAPHWIIVRTTDGSDIIAERTLTGGASGVSYTIGLPVVATRWIATIAGNNQPVSQLSIANPSATETATVTVQGISGGSLTDIAGAVDLTVAPGERVVVDLTQAGLGNSSSVEVVSDVGVVIGQWMTFTSPADIATPVGVPVGGTQSLPVSIIDPTVFTGQEVAPDPSATVPTTEAPLEADGDTASTSTTPSSSASSSSTSTTAAGA